VDIDLNYVGSGDRATMLADKPKVEQSIQAVCAREGLTVKRMPSEHAGGKWRLYFVNTAGSSDNLEVHLNFMLRVPLWPVTALDSQMLGPAVAKEIAVVDRHELAAGKLAALCSRNASRDIFDARELLRRDDIDRGKLRLAFVVYGGMNRKDWRTVRIDDIAADALELNRELVPMLRRCPPARRGDPAEAEGLVRETRELMAAVFSRGARARVPRTPERSGDIAPGLLTAEPAMQGIIRDHPGLKWKALNEEQPRCRR
jgi:hypothetical protein